MRILRQMARRPAGGALSGTHDQPAIGAISVGGGIVSFGSASILIEIATRKIAPANLGAGTARRREFAIALKGKGASLTGHRQCGDSAWPATAGSTELLSLT